MKKLFASNKLALCAIGIFMFLFSQIIHLNLAIPFALIILYSCFNTKFSKIKNIKLSSLSFLFLVSFSLGYLIIKHGLSFYFVPIAIIPMLAVLLFDNLEVASFLSLGSTLSLAALTPEDRKSVV